MMVYRALAIVTVLVLALVGTSVQAQLRPGWPRTVTIGSATIGGVYHVVAGGYARVIGERLGTPATNRVTGGPVHNVELVQKKEIELGMTTTGPLYEGLEGIGWTKVKMDAVRVAFPMYTSFSHTMVPADSPIRSVTDWTGRVVILGPRGSTAEFVGLKLIEHYGLRPRRVVNMGFAEGATAIRDGVADATFGVIGIPVPAWVEAALARPMRFFGFTRDEIDTLAGRYPYLARGAIRAGVYRGQDHVIPTLQVWNAAIVHKDMPEDFVYALVKAIFDSQEFLATVHASSNETLPVNIFYVKMPLHPGAVRYFREQGVRLTAEQLPPEMRR